MLAFRNVIDVERVKISNDTSVLVNLNRSTDRGHEMLVVVVVVDSTRLSSCVEFVLAIRSIIENKIIIDGQVSKNCIILLSVTRHQV